MSRRFLIVTAIGAALSGCMAPNPYTDADFGRSSTLMKAQQVANPDAARNTDPAAGIDGKAVKGAMDNYRNSFRAPSSEAGPAPLTGFSPINQ